MASALPGPIEEVEEGVSLLSFADPCGTSEKPFVKSEPEPGNPNERKMKVVKVPEHVVKKALESLRARVSAQLRELESNKLRVCPFDKNHKLVCGQYRMDLHVQKCRKRYETRKYVVYIHCPYNYEHKLTPPEFFNYHLEHCKDKNSKRGAGVPYDMYDGCDNRTGKPIPKEAILNPKKYRLKMEEKERVLAEEKKKLDEEWKDMWKTNKN